MSNENLTYLFQMAEAGSNATNLDTIKDFISAMKDPNKIDKHELANAKVILERYILSKDIFEIKEYIEEGFK